jgi:hypothetical protein
VDAYNLAYLPMPAQDYLRWLRQSHHCEGDWTLFERALDASRQYDRARSAARDTALRSSPPLASDGAAHSTRVDRFMALSRQIIAQEDLRLAVENCARSCTDGVISSDAERFLAWLRIRSQEAEAETRDAVGYGAGTP